MDIWFIKNSNIIEFQKRLRQLKNISLVADQMCKEGKGFSATSSDIREKSKFIEQLSNLYISNGEYFQLSINNEAKETL